MTAEEKAVQTISDEISKLYKLIQSKNFDRTIDGIILLVTIGTGINSYKVKTGEGDFIIKDKRTFSKNETVHVKFPCNIYKNMYIE